MTTARSPLGDIRDRRLYRDRHPTFEAYCRERWGFSKVRATQLVSAATVVTTVTTHKLDPPRSEGVARALVPFRDDPERLAATWTAVVEAHGPDPTGAP